MTFREHDPEKLVQKIDTSLTPERLLLEAIRREACVTDANCLREEDFIITLEDILRRVRNVSFPRR